MAAKRMGRLVVHLVHRTWPRGPTPAEAPPDGQGPKGPIRLVLHLKTEEPWQHRRLPPQPRSESVQVVHVEPATAGSCR